jgi:Ca2+-binding RTX toxin-like protein
MSHNVFITGTNGNDTFQFSGEHDYYIDALAGNDTIRISGSPFASIAGGAGNDWLENTNSGSVQLFGGTGADTLRGGAGQNTYRFDPLDNLSDAGGEDFIYSTRNFTVPNGVENALLEGNADAIVGSGNNNNIYLSTVSHLRGVNAFGGNGHDYMQGSRGNDTIRGGTGNDTISGTQGADILDGGFGRDIADYSDLDPAPSIRANLATGWVQFVNRDWPGERLVNFEGILLGEASDHVIGSAGADQIITGLGFDRVTGGLGADVIETELGRDVLYYRSTSDSTPGSYDVITDFAGAGKSWGDRINLTAIDANELVAGNQDFVFNHSGTGGVWTQEAWGGRTWVLANNDADEQADLAIMLIDGHAVSASDYSAQDFIL